ncbi:hypothetical protein VMUT_0697 [Vulcanisaeta moutnovskia 768-28]|uniref:Uncharacterized protein n=1 Tax=Vulcanisaeta moutnovskia (strain 768-28) TaxID=985053 RepID=F0QVY4_VULM7|nr:hypothetical protein VMUT_0697 [Vulcanisaeta moutnovskia 768-28]
MNELRSKGFSKLDIYLILRTLKPDTKLEYLLSPTELDLINRMNKLRTDLYKMRTELYDLERKVRRRHEIITGVYEELTKNKK